MMKKQHDKQFKETAVKYHNELAIRGCVKNLGIGCSTLSKWLNESKSESGIQFRGSGNYASDE